MSNVAFDIGVDYKFAAKLGMPLAFAVGLTNHEQRREILRSAIRRNGLADKPAGYNRTLGKSETWGEVFARVYGEPL